jgi:hypothetical protein
MTTLANIRAKVRKITSRPSSTQISDAEIDEYINTYYLYDMPESLRLLNLRDDYYFTTSPNVDTYDFSRNSYVSVSGPAYCNGQEMSYMQDQEHFYRLWPKTIEKSHVSTGDGTAGPYSFTISAVPFLRSDNTPIGSKGNTINVTITANSSDSTAETAYDNGAGGFVNAAAGSIDYVTGVTTVTFNNTIPVGTEIYSQVWPYNAGKPDTILFYQDKFIVRPVPDGGYVINLEAFRTPTQLGSSPELAEWWQLLAFGASLKIFTDNADFDQYQGFRPFYEEQLLLMQRRTLKQYSNQRAATIYEPGSGGGIWGAREY